MPPALPCSTRGIKITDTSTAHKPHRKIHDGEFAYSLKFFKPFLFILTDCQSSHGAAHLPSANKGNKSPILRSTVQNLLGEGEGANSEFSLILIYPHHYKLFLTIFPQLNYYPFSHVGCLPLVDKANNMFSCCHYSLTRCM